MAERDEGPWMAGGRPVEDLGPAFPPEPPAAPVDGRRPRRRWLRYGLAALAALFLVTLAWLVITAPLSRALEPLKQPAMLFVSAEGKPIARRGAIKEAPVDVARLDPLTPAAFIAIEDRRFRSHLGIDPIGIGRAFVANLKAGGVRQGGSTLTQQLAKTSFLSSDRSYRRKAQEMIIALWLEAWLTKDEILSRYLSSVYFGDGVYGLRAAARHYFDRSPERLTLAQSAMLAGMMKAPSRLAPTRNLEAAQARSRLVLQAMADTGVITPARARATASARPRLRPTSLPTGTYFADWGRPQAQKAAGGGARRACPPAPISPIGSARRRKRPPGPTMANSASSPRSTPTCNASRCARSRRRRSTAHRPRWWRCAPTARWWRWSAAPIMPKARSTAPPRRAASRAAPTSCSSISRRCAPATAPTT